MLIYTFLMVELVGRNRQTVAGALAEGNAHRSRGQGHGVRSSRSRGQQGHGVRVTGSGQGHGVKGHGVRSLIYDSKVTGSQGHGVTQVTGSRGHRVTGSGL